MKIEIHWKTVLPMIWKIVPKLIIPLALWAALFFLFDPSRTDYHIYKYNKERLALGTLGMSIVVVYVWSVVKKKINL